MVHTAGTDEGIEREVGSQAHRAPALPSDRPIHQRVTQGVSRFTDRYPFVGPVVWMMATVFFVAQVAVAYNWRSLAATPKGIVPDHPYSFFANSISDLAETAKFKYGDPAMWSPNQVWMNVAFVLLGAVMIIGSPLIYQEFNEGDRHKVWVARFAFTAQVLGGVGAILVGLNPENEHPRMHIVGAALAIAVGTLGVFVLGIALPLPGRLRRFMLFCMPVSLVAIVLFALHEYLGFGPGGMEQLAAYPEVIWLISFGFYILRSHYSNGSAHRALQSIRAARVGSGADGHAGPIPPRLRLPARGRLPDGRVDSNYQCHVDPHRRYGAAPGVHRQPSDRVRTGPRGGRADLGQANAPRSKPASG